MKRYLYIFIALFCLLGAACEDDRLTEYGRGEGRLVRLTLSPQETPMVVSRAHSEEAVNENIENAILFIFTQDGKLYKKIFQQFDGGKAAINVYLSDYTSYDTYAICNMMDPDAIYQSIQTLEELKALPLILNKPEEAYRGKYAMSGKETFTVDPQTENYTIKVDRLVAEHDITISFIPDNSSDEFLITKVTMNNLPKGTWVVGRERATGEKPNENCANDWTYRAVQADMAPHYFPSLEVKMNTATPKNGAKWSSKGVLRTLENRRGGVVGEGGVPPADWHDTYWPGSKKYATDGDQTSLDVCRQTRKRLLGTRLTSDGRLYEMNDNLPADAEIKFKYATYLTIEGVYRRPDNSTWNVKYHVYLGADNYKDFNICRNTKYITNISIHSLERIDTRVEASSINDMVFSMPDKILDAHCNQVPIVIAAQDGWEAWVVDPDQTPWLELSKNPVYLPRRMGEQLNADQHASYHLKNDMGGLSYAYLYTDEYLPQLDNPTENSRHTVRVGKIAYRMKGKSVHYLTVRQYPAQMGVLHIKYDVHDMKEVRDTFYIERSLEAKHMPWGLEKFWSFVTDDLIAAGRWDGLANTRRIYHAAIHGDKWGVKPYYTDGKVPFDTALGYTVNKNRDRDGNGKIDDDEILWYWPSVKELQSLRTAINKGDLNFENNDDLFHSSTPSSADPKGTTTGYSYYVKMANGKLDIGPRDRLYNVICMRRKNNEWRGPKGDDAQFQVTVETSWKKDEEIVMPIQ